jgi:hypothetical protein
LSFCCSGSAGFGPGGFGPGPGVGAPPTTNTTTARDLSGPVTVARYRLAAGAANAAYLPFSKLRRSAPSASSRSCHSLAGSAATTTRQPAATLTSVTLPASGLGTSVTWGGAAATSPERIDSRAGRLTSFQIRIRIGYYLSGLLRLPH